MGCFVIAAVRRQGLVMIARRRGDVRRRTKAGIGRCDSRRAGGGRGERTRWVVDGTTDYRKKKKECLSLLCVLLI
jgi:hypothetical protein